MPASVTTDVGKLSGRARRIANYAAIAMLALAGLTVVGIAAYFAERADPWSWRGLVAIATVPFCIVCAGLLWKMPTRENAGAALLVIGFSLVRVGLPSEWTSSTLVLLLVTGAAAAPVVWAARTLPH
ncbi:MAG TPA: hypothetical protein VLM85_33430 [Polyangiaceae bacterium]|nr:hypothetical protein [Polyangiaceae bacterium]